MLPLAVVAWIALNIFQWSNAVLKLGVGLSVTLLVVWLILRLSDIQRRETQAHYGFVEITPLELRVSLSQRSLLRVRWPDFAGTEVKDGWIHFKHRAAQVEQGGQSKRLNRVRFGELESPDALIEALRAHTLSLT